jgi:hypothetical protein
LGVKERSARRIAPQCLGPVRVRQQQLFDDVEIIGSDQEVNS